MSTDAPELIMYQLQNKTLKDIRLASGGNAIVQGILTASETCATIQASGEKTNERLCKRVGGMRGYLPVFGGAWQRPLERDEGAFGNQASFHYWGTAEAWQSAAAVLKSQPHNLFFSADLLWRLTWTSHPVSGAFFCAFSSNCARAQSRLMTQADTVIA